jgi:small subunit ribosomal protein S15
MSITVEKKAEVIKSNQQAANDTGSPEVQVAILTERISALSGHLEQHKKDKSSRRGLLTMVARRRKLLDFLKSRNENRYVALINKLGLRK